MKRALVLVGAILLFQPPASVAQQPAPPTRSTGAETDEEFSLGLRRIGVLAGEAVVCTPDASRNEEIARVNRAGTLIASEFGLRAAFSFIGAAGYGAGLPFDKAICADVLKQWTDVQQRYGER